MRTLFYFISLLFILLWPFLAYSQIDDLIDKTLPTQIDGITPGATNIRSRTYLDTYIFQRFLDFKDARLNQGKFITDYGTITAAITAATNDSSTIYIDSTVVINSKLTLSGEYSVVVLNNGYFVLNDTLDIQVPFSRPEWHYTFRGLGLIQGIHEMNLEAFGAKGDGSTNDSTAFFRAFESRVIILGKSGLTYIVNAPSDTYFVYNGYDFKMRSTQPGYQTNIKVPGPAYDGFLDKRAIFTFKGVITSQDTLADTVLVGQQYFIPEGDGDYTDTNSNMYRIREADTTHPIWQERTDLTMLDHINGDTVFVRTPLWEAYQPPSDTATIYIIDPIEIDVRDVRFFAPSDFVYERLFRFDYAHDVFWYNNTIESFHQNGIRFIDCHTVKVERSSFIDIYFPGKGRGIYLDGTYNSQIGPYNYFAGCRKAIDGGSPAVREVMFYKNVVDCFFDESAYDPTLTFGVGTHQNCEGWVIEGNIFNGCYTGVNVRSIDTIIRGNEFRNPSENGIIVTVSGGTDLIVDDNVVTNWHHGRTVIDSTKLLSQFVDIGTAVDLISNNKSRWIFTNNKIYGLWNIFMRSKQDTMWNVVIDDNWVFFQERPGHTNNLLASSPALHLINSYIGDNFVSTVNTYSMFDANITFDTLTVSGQGLRRHLTVTDSILFSKLSTSTNDAYITMYKDTLVAIVKSDVPDTIRIAPRRLSVGSEIHLTNNDFDGDITNWQQHVAGPNWDTFQYDATRGGLEIRNGTLDEAAFICNTADSTQLILEQSEDYVVRVWAHIDSISGLGNITGLRFSLGDSASFGSLLVHNQFWYFPEDTGDIYIVHDFTSAADDTVVWRFYNNTNLSFGGYIDSVSVKKIFHYK